MVFGIKREDISDASRLITGSRAPRPETRDVTLGSSSRKATGLRRDERARHMTDDQLKAKYQKSFRKMVRHGGAILGAETGAVGAAKVLHAPLGLDKLKAAGESSVKGARQAVRSEIYKQELVDRGYPAALGLPAPPSDVGQLKRVLKSYGGSGARGLGKGLFDQASEEVRDPGVPRDPGVSLPMNKPMWTFSDGNGGFIHLPQ
ncbi:hypothetical protein B0T24DRAFT_720998 [Lasiosphaeria ovina]|uniref:Uncharacterized protein n=1 Tax=Lasiosphaeria ovina TaxID=92902 RepID=A0AAE0KEL8_9PEZI|nr:hypothetical protein B0T24DRAFT_720998 [Lasiosphaeria ovina]